MSRGRSGIGRALLLAAGLALLAPCVPGQIVGLWNNFRAAAEKNGWEIPVEPLYFLKAPNSYAARAVLAAAKGWPAKAPETV